MPPGKQTAEAPADEAVPADEAPVVEETLPDIPESDLTVEQQAVLQKQREKAALALQTESPPGEEA